MKRALSTGILYLLIIIESYILLFIIKELTANRSDCIDNRVLVDHKPPTIGLKGPAAANIAPTPVDLVLPSNKIRGHRSSAVR